MPIPIVMDDSSTSRHIQSAPEDFHFDVGRPLHHIPAERITDSNSKASIAPRYENHDNGPLRVTLSVGGMSCSSCSSTITTVLSDLQGVSEVTVSFLGQSASFVVDHMNLVGVVVETVKDCGYEAEVISVELLGVLDYDSTTNLRTIALRIDGMFCQ